MGIVTFLLIMAAFALITLTGLLYGVVFAVLWVWRKAAGFSQQVKQTRQQAIEAHSVTIEMQGNGGGYRVVE